MIITISGLPGSGKSTVAKLLAKKLGYVHHSTGDFMGELAVKRGVSLLELSKLAEKDSSIDKAIDDRLVELQEEDDLVIDSRLGFHFIPNSVKIFLDVDPDIGATRVFGNPRPDEKENKTIALTKANIAKRIASERMRYKKYYGVDCYEKKYYDIVVDTSERAPEEVVQKILDQLNACC